MMNDVFRVKEIVFFIIVIINFFIKGDPIPYIDQISVGLGILYVTWVLLIEWARNSPKFASLVGWIVESSLYKYLRVGYIVIVAISFIATGIMSAYMKDAMKWYDEVVIFIALFLLLFSLYSRYRKIFNMDEEVGATQPPVGYPES